MTISAISAVSPASLMPSIQPSTAPAGNAAGGDFGSWLGDALDSVSGAQNSADQLAVKAATGDLTAIHDYTIAASEAQILTQLTVEVRNRAVEAFNDIMRMQV